MIVENYITVKRSELSKADWKRVFKRLTFMTEKGDVVECFKINGKAVKVPRGAWSVRPLRELDYVDRRTKPKMPALDFTVELDDVEKDERYEGQTRAISQMFQHEQGLVIRPPGTGKTQIALGFIAQCETRSLVLVHTKDILEQWVEYAQAAIPGIEIGVIQGNRCTVGHLTIATVQSIRNYIDKKPKAWWGQWGCVILDEAHHAAAGTFEAVLNTCPAFYRFGFTASPTRADGLEPVMKYVIGPVIHKQKFSSPVKLTVVPVKTKFYFAYRGSFDWTRLVNALIRDPERNLKIATIADREISKGNSVLVLSRRIEHLENVAALMRGRTRILTGAGTPEFRRETLAAFRNGKLQCLLSTQLADEALDVPRLNRVLLVHPGKHEGRIIQQIGRAIRQHESKTDAVIYDFVDRRVGVLLRQWMKRKATYRSNKISVRKKVRKMIWAK